MKEARVFVAQDQQSILRLIKALLKSGGHSVVVSASTMGEAADIIPKLKELEIDVAVLDANLDEKSNTGDNGRAMVSLIHAVNPDIKIVGISGRKFPVPVDVDLGLDEIRNLPKVVDQL